MIQFHLALIPGMLHARYENRTPMQLFRPWSSLQSLCLWPTKQTWAIQFKTSPMHGTAMLQDCRPQARKFRANCVRKWTLRLDNFLHLRGMKMYETTHFCSQLGLTKGACTKILYQFSQLVTRLQFFSKGSQLGLVPGNGCRQNLA